MYSLSTGEPPTPPNDNNNQRSISRPSSVVQGVLPAGPDAISDSASDRSSDSGQRLRRHSYHDSGYEASPNLVNDLLFYRHIFGSQNSVDDVFEDCPSSAVLLEDEDQDWCPDCGEDSSCTCSRAESSATVRANITSNYATDSSDCDSDCGGQSSPPFRPSSMPIVIPRLCPDTRSRLPYPPNNSAEPLPIHRATTNNLVVENLCPHRSHPGSFPAAVTTWWHRLSPSSWIASGMARAFHRTPPPSPSAGTAVHIATVVRASVQRTDTRMDTRTHRSRRRRIDSDASSSCEHSSDEYSPSLIQDARGYQALSFPMAGESPLYPLPRVSPHEPLPDIVLQSSPSTTRRTRSQSINLPPEPEVVRNVGRTLRRLSEEFELSRTTHLTIRRQSITGYLLRRSS